MNFKNLIDNKINRKQALKLFYISFIICIFIFGIIAYIFQIEDFMFALRFFELEIIIGSILLLSPLIITILYKLIKRFRNPLKRFLSFICANIFIISINVSVIYIGNKLITELTNTIATSIEKANNIMPVATHDGFAIYNRDEDKFFEYKISSESSKYYERKTYTPSFKIEDINEKYYKNIDN